MSNTISVSNRLFVATFPTGLSFCDRAREKHGDYVRLAFLSFRTLRLEWTPEGAITPSEMQRAIEAHAADLQARRGELYTVSACGQTVRLGDGS